MRLVGNTGTFLTAAEGQARLHSVVVGAAQTNKSTRRYLNGCFQQGKTLVLENQTTSA